MGKDLSTSESICCTGRLLKPLLTDPLEPELTGEELDIGEAEMETMVSFSPIITLVIGFHQSTIPRLNIHLRPVTPLPLAPGK